jgi:hypothetical protein
MLHELRPLQAMAASMFFKHRRLLLVLPRQFGGKTELGIRLLESCLAEAEPTTGLFIAKDTKSARRATREKFLRVFDSRLYSVNTDRIIKRANPRAVINIGSIDKDADRLRGGTNHIIHGSEAAFWKMDHGETILGVFDKILNPTTRIYDGYVLLETTLNGKNGFHDLWQDAAKYGFQKLLVSLSQMLAMGLISQDDYDRTKSTTHPLVFRQEYECEFITFLGRTYDEFDSDIHVQDMASPADWQKVLIAIDWGFDPSATCVLFAYVQDDVLHVFDEIHEKKQRPEETAAAIRDMFEHYRVTSFAAVADHDTARVEELNLRGIPCGLAKKVNVLGNRMQIKEMLYNDKILIHPRCKFLIRDVETAVWNAKKEGELDYSQFTYNHGDAEAALRYLVRELGQAETEKPVENPHIGTDQASARMWNLTRQSAEDV